MTSPRSSSLSIVHGDGVSKDNASMLSNSRRNSFPTLKGSRLDLFAMKVMRLPSPFLQSAVGIPWSMSPDATDLYSVSDRLTVSSTLGTIYLGETFRTCLSVTHCYPTSLTDVTVRIEIHTEQQRLLLTDPQQAAFEFAADSTRDFILNHEISHIGDNSLVVTIQYTSREASNLIFQKFFKLEVKSPFEISTGLHERDDIMFAEMNVHNLHDQPVFLEAVTLEPESAWAIEDLNTLQVITSDECMRHALPDADAHHHSMHSRRTSLTGVPGAKEHLPQRVSTFGRTTPLKANGSRSYLYRVRPKTTLSGSGNHNLDATTITSTTAAAVLADSAATTATTAGATTGGDGGAGKNLSVGRFSLHWRSRMGNAGRIVTSMLTRSAQVNTRVKEYREFTLMVVRCAARVQLEEPFMCEVMVTNVTAFPLTVRLALDRDRITSIIPHGFSSQQVGLIAPHGSKTVQLRFLPLALGVQRLSGFVLSCDELTDAVHQYDNIHQVLVVQHLSPSSSSSS